MATRVETSACQLAHPEQTCPTKILEQSSATEMFKLLVGTKGTPNTFKVVLTDKMTNQPFERQVTVNCHGFSLDRDASGKPKTEEIKGVSMRVLKTNMDEPQFARQTIQQKSAVKAGNEKLFGGKPVLTMDADLNIVINSNLASAAELAAAEPFLSYLESPAIKAKL